MDSFEINKIIAAILLVVLLVIGIGKVSNIVFYVEKPKTPGYKVDVEQIASSSSSATEAIEEKLDIAKLMSLGDIANGEKTYNAT